MGQHPDHGGTTIVTDSFDRALGMIHDLPDYDNVRPATVTDVLPIIGKAQTYIVQSYRNRDGLMTIFVQTVDAQGAIRIVLPDKVANAIYRQREALVTKANRRRGRDVAERIKLEAQSGQGGGL